MRGVSVLLILGVLTRWTSTAVFLNHRPFPTYSLENMPSTQFSCREKILGGYYADPDTQCQMFHVCVKVAGIGVQDFRFLCPNGTAFDQDHQICAEWEDVDCDASTLYYSSDNFDLYRIGSGFESKAVRYGEEEETFALQRAETGDIRLNREPQTQVVNQQKDYRRPAVKKNYNNNNNNQERDIFKGSSSSNFFNNRNNGKENDDDYDDNVNINQNNDYQGRKIVRKLQRKPSQQNNQQQSSQPPKQQVTSSPSNNLRGRNQRPRNNAVSQNVNNSPTPTYTVSTPAPFRQNPSTSNRANTQTYTTTTTSENYPKSKPTTAPVNYNYNFDVQKNTKQTENYPSNNPIYSKTTTPVANNFNTAFSKEQSSVRQYDNPRPTTFSPSAKPFSLPNHASQQNTQTSNTFPTTFAPRTQQAFTQIAQKTIQQNTYNTQNPSTFNQQFTQSTTQKSSPFTQYTPTVPKISPTTPVSRSNRFDETQYDDGSYNSKYDYNGDDEFLKTAHSQNIASSRNELAKTQKQAQSTSITQKPYVSSTSTSYPTRQTENYPKPTQYAASRNTQVTQKVVEKRPKESSPKAPPKKVKDVSYDYAYYDSLAAEPDYQLDLDIKKEKN
ncbi:putative mediator of RNA polymerase II transcription subunit 26 [Sitophilus oryzae]|uniref:Mediator of RNA polymerase II transcription subunit 26 n=1 Tax=Sitophilus oryzae TaxID=7048 RepID=A0A6J2YTG1_SITOR|nr:putative mediator of RNA polymerase II transcription subunit 26 [Sitophilus oryzae]